MDALDSRFPVLNALQGTLVNVDQLDYLAKRLDSFCVGEDDQYKAMAHKLEQSYNGHQFPAYLYDVPLMVLEVMPKCGLREGQSPEYLYLPALNRMCRAIGPLNDADMEKLNAVVLMAEPGDIFAICELAENLDQFDFVPGIHTPEEYGKYMIRESGRFEYDAALEGFYDYRLYGEQHVRQEGGQFNECGYVAYHGAMTLEELKRGGPAEQHQREPELQMGGLT